MAHPRKFDLNNPLIQRLRETCLALAEDVFEKEAWGECTYRVTKATMFAMSDCNHHGSGHTAVWIKAPALAQDVLVKKDPKVYFIPPYMGTQGWIGVRLDGKVKWKNVKELLLEGYQMSGKPANKKKTATANKVKKGN